MQQKLRTEWRLYKKGEQKGNILGWPRHAFRFFCNLLWRHFGQYYTNDERPLTKFKKFALDYQQSLSELIRFTLFCYENNETLNYLWSQICRGMLNTYVSKFIKQLKVHLLEQRLYEKILKTSICFQKCYTWYFSFFKNYATLMRYCFYYSILKMKL